jgi:hypothetical protein
MVILLTLRKMVIIYKQPNQKDWRTLKVNCLRSLCLPAII